MTGKGGRGEERASFQDKIIFLSSGFSKNFTRGERTSKNKVKKKKKINLKNESRR